MKTKEKVFLICRNIIAGRGHDAALLAAGLTLKDIDALYAGAEKCVIKARSKPAIEPTGVMLEREVRDWINFYEWPETI